jgi:hypothetical protein
MNYTNKKYNKLTLLHKARAGGQGVGAVWLAVCDCGNTLEVLARKVKSNDVKSCGNCGKGLGIQGSGRIVKQGIPRGHREQFSKLIKQAPGSQLTAGEYLEIAQKRCLCCGVREPLVEWADEKKRESSTDLIPICKECSSWRKGRNIQVFLRYILRTAQCIRNQISDT